jgi:hypothetical protein
MNIEKSYIYIRMYICIEVCNYRILGVVALPRAGLLATNYPTKALIFGNKLIHTWGLAWDAEGPLLRCERCVFDVTLC